MAGVLKPLFINLVEYDAESERRGFGGLVAQSEPGIARTGVLGPVPDVTLSGSTVRVGAFACAIGSAKGMYLTGLDSVTTAAGTVAPADATNARLDRVVLEVPADPISPATAPEHFGRLRLIPGTAAAIPTLPDLPPLSLHVAQVDVPRNNNGEPTLIIDPPLTAAAGAPVPVRSVTERAGLDPAMVRQAYRLDTGGTDFVGPNGKWVSSVEGLAGSAGWNVIGTVERSRVNRTNVRSHLSMRLVRSGGTFAVGNTGGFIGATGAVLPAEFRPTAPVDVPASYVSSASTWGGNAIVRIETTGAISILPVAPTTTLNVTKDGYFTFSADWIS